MNNLPPHTIRRINKLPQASSIWEGDRRSLEGMTEGIDLDSLDEQGDCIIWVDGSEGIVRAMEIVSPVMGIEAVVRALIKAMENPQNPAFPCRPHKIIVRDRELHFFLRGALSHLQIEIDYVPELPLIDELFRGFQQLSNARMPSLPPQYLKRLNSVAEDIWEAAPWQELADHHIIAIHLNALEIDTLYISIMGLLGKDYGILMYRSLDSLKRFRSTVLNERSVADLEKAFLLQDCWFVNYEIEEQEDFLGDVVTESFPLFGSLHPLEGMRPFLDPEEALVVSVALEALLYFVRDWQEQNPKAKAAFESYQQRYSLSLPPEGELSEILSVEVATCPDLAHDFLEMIEQVTPSPTDDLDWDEDEFDYAPLLHEDLIPDNAIVMLRTLSPDELKSLQNHPKTTYLAAPKKSCPLPALWIQTSRPKGKEMITRLKNSPGLKGLCLNPGEDPFTESFFDLGLLQTEDDNLYLLAEFDCDRPLYIEQRRQWNLQSQKSQGFCCIVISMGVTGSAKGEFRLQDVLAVFETRLIAPAELGMGTLELVSQFQGYEVEY